jgi:hypothetical protein
VEPWEVVVEKALELEAQYRAEAEEDSDLD